MISSSESGRKVFASRAAVLGESAVEASNALLGAKQAKTTHLNWSMLNNRRTGEKQRDVWFWHNWDV
jgi:hypothetical protein